MADPKNYLSPAHIVTRLHDLLPKSVGRSDIGANLTLFARTHRAEVERPASVAGRIEIIIPCYNHSQYLELAVKSILNQSFNGRLSVTLIDDNSTDDTPEIIKKLVDQDHGRRFIFKHLTNPENLRQWGSLNLAISESTNELMVVLNDDDLLLPDCLEKIVQTYGQHPDIYLLGAQSLWLEQGLPMPKHEPKPLSKLKLTEFEPRDARNWHHLNELPMTQSSCSFFKSAWQAVGGYYPKESRISPEANEDRDLQMRVASLLPVGVYLDYPFAYWRLDSSHGQDF